MAERDRTEQRESPRRHTDEDFALASFAVDHAAVAIFMFDEQARVVRVNQEACRSLGYTEDELLSLTLHDITVRFDMDQWPDHWRALRLSGTAVLQDVHRRKDGSLVDVEIHDNLLRFQGREVNVAFALDLTERQRAQRTLAERERMLSTLFGNLPGMAYGCVGDRAWTMAFVSDGCLQLTERTPSELIGNATLAYADIIHPDDRDRVWDEISAALEGREPWTITYRLVMPDERVKWVWERGVGVRDSDDTPVHIEGFITDVSEQRQVEEALRDREQMLSGLVASLPGATYRSEIGKPWRTSFMSAGCLDLTGYTPDELINGERRWADIIHPDDLAMVVGNLERDLAGEKPVTLSEYRIRIKGGEERWILDRAVFVRGVDGGPVELVGQIFDISARRAAEQALRESESLHRTLFQQAPVGVVLYDANLVILDCNDAFAQIVGAAREQLIGFDLTTSRDPRPLDALRRPMDGGHGVYEGPYTTTTTGRDLWITAKTAPRLRADGEAAGAMAVVTDHTSQRRAEDEMERLRLHDPVTGLPNRSLFADRIAQALAHAQRKRLGFAVAAVAIDRFSSLVDTLGHEACDRLLAAAAKRLAATMRTEDTVACLAASEFGFLLAGVGGPAQASASVEKTVAAFAQPFQVDGHEVFLNLSLGVAVYPADGADPQDLIENAEVAARRASSQGGNSWQFFHASMNGERAGRLALEGELHRALERQQFLLHYQPIVEAGNGEIVGLEALLRWDRPGKGLLQPLDFVAVAEEIGLMVPIGAWVLRTACVQARAWGRALGRPLRIAVNLSARQLYEASLEATVRAALKGSGLPARQLELEITETAAMRDPQQAGRILGALRKRHVRIALDDFGTGYSSLSHLVRLPIATVKIDRSFVRDLLSVPEHAAVAASVIALGHRLGLTVVAEGVETQAEREFLRDEGCDALQGYLFSKPLPPDECARVLEAGPIVR